MQFFALDDRASHPEELPVVCTIGINYSQRAREVGDVLRPFHSDVIAKLGPSRLAVSHVLAAYTRNRLAWTTKLGVVTLANPRSVYGSHDALSLAPTLRNSDPKKVGDFFLIMTNISPLISKLEWNKHRAEDPRGCDALLAITHGSTHLDNLYDVLGTTVDVWIGHSGKSTTHDVWPEFSNFVNRHTINNWLLSCNISGSGYLAILPKREGKREAAYTVASHELYDWYSYRS